MPSKLTLHTDWGSSAAMDFVRRANPRVVKVVDAFGAEADVKAASPHTRIVGRVSYDGQPDIADGDPAQRAREFFGAQKGVYLRHPLVDYWEGWNEPAVETPEQMTWYAAHEAERVRLLGSIGRKACLANFPTGSPGDLALWPRFFPALREGKKHGAILGLHEYSAPRLDSHFGKNQTKPDEDEGDTGWTTCRYRKIYRAYLNSAYLGLPLVITEAGIDGRVLAGPRSVAGYDNAPRTGGWRLFGAWWARNGGLQNPAEEYLRQLIWYDQRLQEDPYVWGAAVYHMGQPGRDRESYSIAGDLIVLLTDYCRAQPPLADPDPAPRVTPPVGADLGAGPAPAHQGIRPAPAAASRRGKPREEYSRVYVLLPPDASLDLVQAAAAYYYTTHYTLGFSPDDAGIGDLQDRRVIAVDAHRWPGDLAGWFTDHYPGVTLEPVSSSAIYSRTVIGRCSEDRR